jgi:hypothetical protein
MTSGSEHNHAPPVTLPQRPKMPHATPVEVIKISTPSVSNPSKKNGGKKKKNASKAVNLWSPAEDQKLLGILQTMQPIKWKQVAESFPTRSDYACRRRYEEHLKST